MVCSLCKQKGHNKRTCKYKDNIERLETLKYNIYIICNSSEDFNIKKDIFKDINNIDNIYHIKSQYLKKNERLYSKLNTRYNTSKSKIISKLGCIASHKNALLSIDNYQTINNLILEEDFILNNDLPEPPNNSCYMGGWICPPKVSDINKIKININTVNGLNNIYYDKFNILMTHAIFIKTPDEANNILISILSNKKIKNYDIYLKEEKFINKFYYPPLFIQANHISNIDKKYNNNHIHSINYGLSTGSGDICSLCE